MKDEIKEKIKYFNHYVVDNLSLDAQNDFQKILDYITNLQEKLEVSQTNEETYRLEMLDITKCLGLEEDTIFDEVKEYATNLQEENKNLKLSLKDRLKYSGELDEKIEIIDKASDFIKEKISSTQGVINDYMYHKEHNQHLIELLREDIEMYKKELNLLQGSENK